MHTTTIKKNVHIKWLLLHDAKKSRHKKAGCISNLVELQSERLTLPRNHDRVCRARYEEAQKRTSKSLNKEHFVRCLQEFNCSNYVEIALFNSRIKGNAIKKASIRSTANVYSEFTTDNTHTQKNSTVPVVMSVHLLRH